ncbi:MAG: DUF1513 domain-containing protein [Pseudomonadota bacterium]
MNPPPPPFSKGGSAESGEATYPDLSRRHFLSALGALFGTLALPARATSLQPRLAASWQRGSAYQVGLLALAGDKVEVAAALDLPTRAHGLLWEAAGTLLAVARRPGDWLLRWNAAGEPLAWRWIEPGRAFTGHVVASADGATLYTPETDLETGAGLIGVRDAASLEKQAEWPTHGIDPHQLLTDAQGRLWVANGGVPTRPETGRAKVDLPAMDASLACLAGRDGSLLGQWRLADRRLSLRHLAWNGGRLGIALQSEHDDPARRAAAPVLAVFDGRDLLTAGGPPLAGYGGDVARLGDGFAVSCPRAQGVACFGPAGEWRGLWPLPEACALSQEGPEPWAGGRDAVLAGATALALPPGLRLDNHWLRLG